MQCLEGGLGLGAGSATESDLLDGVARKHDGAGGLRRHAAAAVACARQQFIIGGRFARWMLLADAEAAIWEVASAADAKEVAGDVVARIAVLVEDADPREASLAEASEVPALEPDDGEALVVLGAVGRTAEGVVRVEA